MAATHTHRIARLEKGLAATQEMVAAMGAQMTAQDAKLDTLLAAVLGDDKPARVTTKSSPAKDKPRKARKAKAPAKPVTKGSQSRESLSRKDWNRTLTTLAKTRTGKNSGAYKAVIAAWDAVSDMRDAGYTPAEALLELTGFDVR